MKNSILLFGLITGGVLNILFWVTYSLVGETGINDAESYDMAAIVGHATLFLAMIVVFFGIKRYRDVESKGSIGFGRAVGVGMAITGIAATMIFMVTMAYYGVKGQEFIEAQTDRFSQIAIDRINANPDLTAEQKSAGINQVEAQKPMQNSVLAQGLVMFLPTVAYGFLITMISSLILYFWKNERPGHSQPAVA